MVAAFLKLGIPTMMSAWPSLAICSRTAGVSPWAGTLRPYHPRDDAAFRGRRDHGARRPLGSRRSAGDQRAGISAVAHSGDFCPGTYRLLAALYASRRNPNSRHDPSHVSIGGLTWIPIRTR